MGNVLSKISSIFKSNNDSWEGVPPIKIFLLRLLFVLMLFVLGKDVWSHILNFQGIWEPTEAMAWCVWGSFSLLSILGVIHPLKMLPIILLEILYKTIWLILVAYPLWSSGALIGSAAEEMTYGFLWVALPIIATPWKYVFNNFIRFSKK